MSTSNPANKPSTGLPTSKPEEVGFSSERLARVGPAMQKYIDKRIVPGIVTLVAHHGRVIHFEHQGLMDIDAGKSMTDDTIFRIMSMTKPIVSVGLMTLYATAGAVRDALVALRRDGSTQAVLDRMIPFAEFNALVGLPEVQRLERELGADRAAS